RLHSAVLGEWRLVGDAASGRRRNGFHPRTARRVRFDGRLLEQAKRVDRGQLVGHTTILGGMHERWRHATLIARGLVLSHYGSIDEHLFSGGIRRPEPAGVRFALPRRGAVGGKGDGESLVAAYHVLRDGLYRYEGFDQPNFQQFADPPVLHAGEGIEWRCHYQNNSDKTYTYGPDATTQEHCILFGAYYPTSTVQEAINCTHDKDTAGHDVSTVAIVPGE